MALRQTSRQFCAPATVLPDNGSCFVGTRRKNPKEPWPPVAFEEDLLGRGIELINPRPCHSQTNGKLERFHRAMEEICHYEILHEYTGYYNERRLHFSLDISNYETLLKAFSAKVTKEVRTKDLNWMEVESNDYRT